MKNNKLIVAVLLITTVIVLQSTSSSAQEKLPYYLRDRGTGIPTSQFGTYIRKGQFLIYPFYEYYYDHNLEYEPYDFGFPSKQELRGKYRAHEFLIFIGYAVSDKLAFEFEAGIISAKLDKSKNDVSPLPPTIEESGLSDVEGQIRWRWNFEDVRKPEFFSYFEYVLPTGEKNSLIGTSNWEFKLGSGVVKGFRWGTMTFRLAFEYDTGEKKIAPGEYALEYLKRLSPRFRFFAMVEGADDEVALVPEIQWHATNFMFVKLATGVGLTSKATDFAPEVGIMFSVN